MGVKSSARKRRQPKKSPEKGLLRSIIQTGVEFAPPGKRRPGKPTLKDDELVARRDAWAQLLETYWARVGWQLKCARSPADLLKAFQPLAGETPRDFTARFLRSSTEAATGESLRKTRKEREKVYSRLRETEERRCTQADSVQDAEGAVFELSEQHNKQLQNEVKMRKANLREIRSRITKQKGRIRKAELSLKNPKCKDRELVHSQLTSLEVELSKIRDELADEERILKQLWDRLRPINAEHRKIATEILAQRKAALDATEQEVSDRKKEREKLEKKLLDQEAYFCQAELLSFVKEKRYAHNPRNLANALAGLPDMGYRRSAARCAKLQYTWVPNLNYTVFEFIERTWRRRHSAGFRSWVRLFRTAITKLPKTQLVPKVGRRDNYLRTYLEENWVYLERAIVEARRANVHPRQVPYVITAGFQENLLKPKTRAEILFVREQRLHRA